MTRIYFDITDIVYFASRYNRVTGIQRVQLNIITLLAHKHGGDVIRCVFFDRSKKVMFEFDPARRPPEFEFDAELLLVDLGLARSSTMFPSKAQIKSYLRQYNNNKLLRTWKKIGVYFHSLFMPDRLAEKGMALPSLSRPARAAVPVSAVAELPVASCLVSLGALWFTPEVWDFAQAHRNRGGQVVQMVYDLIPILHPEYYSPAEPPAFTAWLNSALSYTSRFICISKWTAGDLIKYAGERACHPVVQAIPLAHEFIGFERTAQCEAPASLSSLSGLKYVLCVGTIESRKNGIALLEIWQQFIEELGQRAPLLVFAGKFGRGGAEFQERLEKDGNLSRFVRIAQSPSDRDLAWLYSNSLFTAYVSKIEGWGLPVGESAWFGKYCVTSKTTSMPEVCGELMDYVDPFDVESIKTKLKKAIVDEDFLKGREKGIADAKLRLWADVADDIYGFVNSR